jgi:hypothetical protein
MKIDAFDLSEVGVSKARKLAEAAGVSVEFCVADCDDWSWPLGKRRYSTDNFFNEE